MELTSPAFTDGGNIPEEYGYEADNVNPPLEFTDVPEDAESLVLIVDDPDALEPAGKVWDHWVVFDIDPTTDRVPEDWNGQGVVEGQTDYGETEFGGPNPPGDRVHTYRFRLFAVDEKVGLDSSASKADVESAIEGHVLAEAQLEGVYPPQ